MFINIVYVLKTMTLLNRGFKINNSKINIISPFNENVLNKFHSFRFNEITIQ